MHYNNHNIIMILPRIVKVQKVKNKKQKNKNRLKRLCVDLMFNLKSFIEQD